MWRFWTWYDRQYGLWKLLPILLFLVMGLGAMSLGFAMKEPNPFLIFGGLFFIFLVFSSYAWHLNREAKSKKPRTRGRRL